LRIRIGTRGSALALAQSEYVAGRLRARGHEAELVTISTTGDRVTDREFTDVGSFGVFVRELETALLDGAVDVAVHSYKDVPSRMPAGLAIVAVPERVDAADVLLVRRELIAEPRGGLPLAVGARVGTSATRRRALLLDARPDLVPALLRGNVPTRVRALLDGKYDAIVLAAAGLERLARADGEARLTLGREIVTVRLDPAVFVPAPSQGAIAVQVAENNTAIRDAVARIDDRKSRRAVIAERAALYLADGGCTLPFGAWCDTAVNERLSLHLALGQANGKVLRALVTGTDPEILAREGWHAVTRGAAA
jgi:hydroxymethylbilane synthase